MKFLVLVAHPDDEAIGPGGTIRLLKDKGHEIVVVSATAGGAGVYDKSVEAEVKKAGSLAILRKKELAKSCQILGVDEFEVLKFKDGKINNEIVWGKLTLAFVEAMDKHKPDAVITFDHSGWYFHLDHVGVSIATALAFQQAEFKPKALLFSTHFPRNIGRRWKYVFPEKEPGTHFVDIARVAEIKNAALKAHLSQQGTPLWDHIKKPRSKELFQLAFATDEAKKLLKQLKIFKKL